MGNKANEKDRIGWHYLRDMFYKWLAGEANDVPQNNPNPFWVDIDWVLSYEKAEEQWNDAIETLILNENAIKQIKKYFGTNWAILQKKERNLILLIFLFQNGINIIISIFLLIFMIGI